MHLLSEVNTKAKTATKVVIDGKLKLKDKSGLFCGLSYATSITGLDKIDVSEATSLENMFAYCEKLISISGVENWNVSNVTNMAADIPKSANKTGYVGVFENCSRLTDLSPLKDWDVRKVTTMYKAFNDCKRITSLEPLKNWTTNALTDMGYMFSCCAGLTSLEGIRSWNVSKVKNMNSAFNSCTALKSLAPLDGWKTTALEDMGRIFGSCKSITSLDGIGNWNVSNVTTVESAFAICSLLNSADLSKWSLDSVTNMGSLFLGTSNLNEIKTPAAMNSAVGTIDLPASFTDKATGTVYENFTSAMTGMHLTRSSAVSYLSDVADTVLCFRKTVDGKAEGIAAFTFGVFNEKGEKKSEVQNDSHGNIFVDTANLPLGKYYVQELTQSNNDMLCDTSKQWFTIELLSEDILSQKITWKTNVTYNTVDPKLLLNNPLFISNSSTTILDNEGNAILTLRSYCGDKWKACTYGKLEAGKAYIDPTEDVINKVWGKTYFGPHKGELAKVLRYIMYFYLDNPQSYIWDVMNYNAKINIENYYQIPTDFHWGIITPPDPSMQPQIVALVTNPRTTSQQESESIVTGQKETRVTKLLSPEAVFSNITVASGVTPSEILISKTNLGGTPLPGAKMKLETEQGAEIDTWLSETTDKSFSLIPGKYKLIETSAPSGYKPLTTAIAFTLSDSGDVTVDRVSENDRELVATEGNTLKIKNSPAPSTGGGSTPEPTDPDPTDPEPEVNPEKPDPEQKPDGTETKPDPEDKDTPDNPIIGHVGSTPIFRELPNPNDSDAPDTVIIMEDGVPLTYKKVQNEDGTFEYILDEDVPLVPKTNDNSRMNLWLMMMLSSAFVAGLLLFEQNYLTRRRDT